MSEEKLKLNLTFLQYRFLYMTLLDKLEYLKNQDQTPDIKEYFKIIDSVKEQLWKKMDE